MGENTSIGWCHDSFNLWHGCMKIATGCKFCYAERQTTRFRDNLWGSANSGAARQMLSESNSMKPYTWNRAAACGKRRLVFAHSMSDVFEPFDGPIINHKNEIMWYRKSERYRSEDSFNPGVDPREMGFRPATLDDLRGDLFEIINTTPFLTWLVLTKRASLIASTIARVCKGHMYMPNVWLGTSVSCQDDADENIHELLKCRPFCSKLFVSYEPATGPVDLSPWLGSDGLDWVIAGGESGPKVGPMAARRCDLRWLQKVVEQCAKAGVPCFVKQLGTNPGRQLSGVNVDNWSPWTQCRDKKGEDFSGFPSDLKVRQHPPEGVHRKREVDAPTT